MPHYGTDPQVPDEYTRFMAQAFDQRERIVVGTAFQAFFGMNASSRTEYIRDDNDIDLEVVKGNRHMAALIPRGKVGRILNSEQTTIAPQWKAFSRTFPLIEELHPIDANQLLWRIPGEPAYSSMTRMDKMRALARDGHSEHVRRIVRLYEYMAAQAILTGTMPAGDGETYDFLRDANLTAAVGTTWLSDDANPLSDIADMYYNIKVIGKAKADMIVFARDTARAFYGNGNVQTFADNRRIELVSVSENNQPPAKFNRFIEGGFIPNGFLRTEEGYTLWIFTADHGYETNADVFTEYLDDGYALLADSGARCDRYFGPDEKMPVSPTIANMYTELFGFSPMAPPMPGNIAGSGDIVPIESMYFDFYMPDNGKSLILRTQAAPIYAPTEVDAFAVLTGCADEIPE